MTPVPTTSLSISVVERHHIHSHPRMSSCPLEASPEASVDCCFPSIFSIKHNVYSHNRLSERRIRDDTYKEMSKTSLLSFLVSFLHLYLYVFVVEWMTFRLERRAQQTSSSRIDYRGPRCGSEGGASSRNTRGVGRGGGDVDIYVPDERKRGASHLLLKTDCETRDAREGEWPSAAPSTPPS